MHRRTFLKISAALGAAAHLPPAGGLAIGATRRLTIPHRYFPDPAAMLAARLSDFDLLLVPAWLAAELIRRGALLALDGLNVQAGPLPRGTRAHDPEDAFTWPHSIGIGGLMHIGCTARSLQDLWEDAGALWPDSARLAIGAALLRRGYPLNDTNAGHLAQAGQDLLRLRPRLHPEPAAGLRLGQAVLALDVFPIERLSAGPAGGGLQVCVPEEGAALIEYDWAIPRGAARPEAALACLAGDLAGPGGTCEVPHLAPLTPLPARTQARLDAMWARVRQAAK